MFNNSTTVGGSEILSHLATIAGLKPLPACTAKELADAIDENARAERDAGDMTRFKHLLAIRDCIDAIAGVKDELDAANADIDTLDIEQGATRAHAALSNIEYALTKMVFYFA